MPREQTATRRWHDVAAGLTVLASALLLILITACGGSNWSGDHPDKDNYALAITPSNPTVTVGHSLHLTATSPWGSGAHWSVLPASAGTIDTLGNFTAGNTPASATITAMWADDVRYTATTTVTIVSAPVSGISLSIGLEATSETASVPAQIGSTYLWTIEGGTILSGQGTPTIQFRTSGTGITKLGCTVTDAAGDTADASLIVPPNIRYQPSAYTLIRGADMERVVPTNIGGAALNWQVSPALPAGLSLEAGTGVLSGTPTTPAPETDFTITATNAGGPSAPVTLHITVIDSAPVFSYVPDSYVFTLASAIAPVAPILTHGTVTSWKISPALPSGLVLDSTTGQISGTPAVLASQATYTVTASNNWGSSTSAPVSIAVVDVPPAIHYAPADFTFTRGTPIAPIVPGDSGGPAVSWAITPALSSGLAFDPSTGVISGTPTAINPAVTYSVTATNTGGTSAAASLRLTVLDIVPAIRYPVTQLFVTIDAPQASFLPANSGGPATSWSIQPALPSGLVFDETSGAISGTPAAAASPASYSITATNSGGTSPAFALELGVFPRVTATLSASATHPPYGATVTLTPDFANAISASIGTTQGGSDISSAPASGAALSTAAITSAHTYWLRATNAAGDFVDSSVNVAPQTVAISPITPAAPTRTVDSSTTFTATATGGVTNNLSWSASAGTIDSSTGAWTAPANAGAVTITAISSDDSSETASTVASVVSAATASIAASSTNPAYGATVQLEPTFAGAVSASIGSTQGGSDIAGAPTSGTAISTSAITSAHTYWLRATNAAGDFTDSSVTVTPQTVAVSPISPAAPTRTVDSSTTFTATSTGGVTNGITWSASSGTINSSTGAWTAPATAGSVTITATSNDDVTKSATTTVNVVLAATASISASSTNPAYGASINLTPTFTNAVSASIGTTQGGSDISAGPTSGTAISTSAITSPHTYWLRATNAAGDFADSSVTVTPQTVVVNPISPANPTRTVSSATTFTTTSTGGVTNGITWSASIGVINSSTGAWTAPAAPGSVTITATSKDDATKSATTTVNVVALPTGSLDASTTTPLYGATVNLTPHFANATSAAIGTTQGGSDLSSSPVAETPITTAAITAATTFWLRATNAAGSSADSSVTVTPQTASISAITKSASNVSVGYTATAKATVSNAYDSSVDWTATCGTFSATNTASGVNTTWTAPASPATCTLTAKSHAKPSLSSTASITVVALPIATSLTASTTNPPYKGTVTLTGLFSNGTGVVDHGVGTVTNNVGKASGTITTATTFTLTVTNAAGQTATAESPLVTPQTVVVNPITPANPTITVSQGQNFSTTATGGATNVITWSASGGSINSGTGAWTAPPTPATISIVARSNEDPTKTATTTVTVVAMPTSSITASTTTPQYGAAVNLTPTFTGAVSASVGTTQGGSDISSSPTSGTPIATGAITSSTKYWLRAINAGGTPVDSSVTVAPQSVTINATTATGTVSVGYTTTAQATVANAVDTSVNWSASCGTFTATSTPSGVNTVWTAPASPQTCTLTAASNAKPSVLATAAITVVALPVATSLSPSTTSPLYGATVSLTPVFSSGTGAVDQGVGAVTSNVGKSSSALTSAITFTLTVTNAAGQTATASSGLITPQTVAVTVPSPAASYVSVGGSQTFTASAENAVNTAVTWTSAGAGSWSGATWTAPATPGVYTITATSVADPAQTNSTTVNVVALPVIQSFTSADPQVSLNHQTLLTGVFTNGGGNATVGTSGAGSSDISSTVVSGAAVATGNLAATTTFTLTVYNLAGSSTAATLTVPVVVGYSAPTTSLAGAMYDQTSTALPDGTVLIAGGQDGTSALDAAQLYDPSTSDVSSAGAMRSARFYHTATLLANATVLIAGGDNGSTLAASELWNGSFTSTGSLNTPRERHTATLLQNGMVLIVGGLNGSSPVVSAELYNPTTRTFTYTAGNLNTARYSHTATLLASGQVLIAGGSNGSVPLKSAELYNPATGTFTVVSSMSAARQRHAAVLLNDGTVAIVGGQGSSAPLAGAEIFHPSNNTFSTTGSMANARDSLTATLLAGSKVAVAGGIDASGVPVATSEMFDPAQGTFSTTALLATPRSRHTATLLQNGQVLLAGGLAQSGATGSAELIDPQDGLPTAIPDSTITAPVGASAGQTGLAASVPSQSHVQYFWMITGGSITAGQGTRNITFSMPASGNATLDALAVSDRILPAHTQFVVTQLPVISSFAAAKPTVTVGGSTTLAWTVQGATNLSIDQGVGAVTGTSALVTVGSLGTTTYTLTATNAGGSVTATTQVAAVPPPIATSLTAASNSVPVGGNTNLTPIFSQGTGSIAPGIGTVSSGPAYPTAAINAPTTFTLTVTNAAGDTAQQSATVGLQDVVVTGISGPQYVTSGRTATYSATVTGSVNTGVTWSASAGSFTGSVYTAPTGPPYNTTQTPVTITATSVNGGTPATFTVQVVPLPVITSFVSTPATANYGGSTTITPTFSLGTGQIQGLGSVTSGQGVASGTLTSAATFTLTVTDIAGDSVSQNLTVNQNTPSVTTPSPTPAGTTVTTGDGIRFTATTTGSANSAVTWTATGGSFAGNLWTAPAAGTYTITAHSVSPAGYSASIVMTVVAAPSLASFSASATSVAFGGSTNLDAVFSGGTATVTPGPFSPTSAVPFSTGAMTVTTTYTLTVTNAAGKSATSTVTVNVIRGVFHPGPALASARVAHTLTLLADGRVLIAGGGASATAEIADATAQTIVPASSAMQAVRSYHTATLLASGRVLLTGGANAGGIAQNTAELFNPATNKFTATSGSMLHARQKHSAALMKDGRVVVFGGQDDSGSVLSSAEIYDPVTDAFSPAPDMDALRESATATPLEDGTVLVAGGDDGAMPGSAAQDFHGSSFTSIAMNDARSGHTATLLPGGSVLLAGGSDLSAPLSTTDIYAAGSFLPGPPLSPARWGHAGNLLASGLALLTGGSADGTATLSSAALYDPTITGYWPTGSLGAARFAPASTILRNGHVLVAGGSSSPLNLAANALNTVEVYDPEDNLTPALPSAALTAPASAPNGATGLTASVPAQGNALYFWSLTNGTITSGLNTRSITFSIATAPSVLSVLVVSDRQVPAQSSVTINPAPTIASFTATPSTNTTGLPTTLAWSASGGSGLTLTINNGVGDVSALSSTTVNTPATSTTYTLTASDSTGNTTKSVTLNAVPMPTASSLIAAMNPVEKGSSTTIVPVFTTNGSASIDHGIGTVASGLAYPTGTISNATTFTLTATNTVGTTATISTTINVMPVVVGAIAGPSNVTVGSSAQYSAAVTGAVDKSVTWSTSAGSITSAGVLTAPATPQDIVVTATSVADPSVHHQATVHVVPEALALSLSAAVNPVLYGGSTTVTPTFSQGTGSIDQGIGTVSSGVAYTTGTITADKTFTLSVTNASGDSATTSLTVQPQAVVVSTIHGPASGNVTQGHTATFSATVTGAVDTSLTWSSGGAGSWSGATWTAPATPGSYTITATSVSGSTNTLSVTVVPAPAITAFAATPPGINRNQSSTLTATFTGAGTGAYVSGVVTPGNLALGSGTPGVTTGPLTASQTYTLTVTNDAGDTATAQTTVQVFLGRFSATATSLAAPRNLPTATLRADGNVLIAGGGGASTSADLFDSAALAFSPAAPLLTGRSGHSATLLANGLILIAGGFNGSSGLASAELYNPAGGTFASTGSLLHARQKHRAILLDSGKVLIVGGAGTATAEVYDPATGSFSATSPMASVRESATVSRLPDGRILVAGGSNGTTRLATAEIYDPATNSFSTAASMLAARQLHTATTLPGGQILIAGGTGSTGPGSAEIFNPSLMRFVATGNMIQPRQEHTSTLLAAGMVLVAAGNSGVSPSAIDQAELFDPSSGTFQKTDFMSDAGTPATGAAATILGTGQVLLTGGTSDGSATVAGSELYTPTDGTAAAAADATISAPAYVAQASTAVAAHVTSASGARYIWMVTGGTLVSGQGTSAITFNMPATGSASLDVLILTGAFVPSHGQATVVGEPAPAIASFTAAANPVSYGGTTTLTPVFSNATAGAVVGTGAAGSSDITTSAASGTPVAIGPITVPTQYRLTATNRAGVSVNQTVTVGVQSVIVSAITPSAPILSAGSVQTFTASVSNAANTGIVWSANGGVMNPSSGAWTAPSTPGPYILTATAAADGVTSSATTATVVALPAVQSFTAGAMTVNYGQATTLTAEFTGAAAGQARIGTSGEGSAQLTSTATSGNAVSTGPLTASTIYTLTVTNAAGTSATQTVEVDVRQPFSATGAMIHPRTGQTTTLLPGGAILIAGGTGAADPGELYTGGSFTATAGAMTSARAHHTATLLANGQVLVAGGADAAGNALDTAELYDPATGRFTATTGNMMRARQDHVAALLPDGSVLIAGGFNAADHQLSDAEIFEPLTGTFTAASTPLLSARQFATATTLSDGRVLIAGGFNGTTHLGTAQIFSGGSFAAQEISMGSARSHHAATLLASGQVLLAGGYNGSSQLASSLLFTPGSPDTFTAAGAMTAARQDATSVLLADGNVLIAGGSNTGGSLSTAELFLSTGSTFTATGSMAAARAHAGSSLLLDGTALVDGGTADGTTGLASAELFDPQDGQTPFQPDAAVTPSTTHAFAQATGLTASAPAHAGNRYVWMIQNGSITAGQATDTVTFSLAGSGDAILDLLVTSDHGIPAHGRATVTSDPLPQLTSFAASLNPVPYGGSTTLTAVFAHANPVTLGTSGTGSTDVSASVTSGQGIVVGPLTATTTYTLTLPPANGTQTTSTVIVSVQPVAITPVAPALPVVTVGHNLAFSATVSQAWNSAVLWTASGGSISAEGLWTAPATPGTYTITATAAANSSVTASTTATVVALPVIDSLSAAVPSVNYNQATTLTPLFAAPAGSTAVIGTNGAGSSQLTANATSGAGLSTGPLTATTNFTLTVTNPAGDFVSQTVRVTVIAPFSPTAPMTLARTGQTTTPLADGRVLVAGGTGAADVADVYSAGTFSPTTSPMQAARRYHTATLLADGRVLLAGGFDGSSVLASAEIYDPATGSFTTTAGSMAHARQHHAAALLDDGRVLVVGGSNPSEHPLSSAEIFDPATGTFTDAGSSMLAARERATATSMPNGDVVITGGSGSNGNSVPSAELWSGGAFLPQLFPMLTARTLHGAALLASGQVLVTGGSASGLALANAETYLDAGTGSYFSPVTGPLLAPRRQHTSTLLASGKVLLAAGTDGASPVSAAELFDPASDTFAASGDMITPRFDAGAALLEDGTVLIAGGTDAQSQPLASAEIFNPQDGLVPALPALGLTAPGAAPAGSVQSASITLPAGARAIWWMENGTPIAAENGTVSFTMASSGNTTVHVLVYTSIGLPITAGKVIVGQ